MSSMSSSKQRKSTELQVLYEAASVTWISNRREKYKSIWKLWHVLHCVLPWPRHISQVAPFPSQPGISRPACHLGRDAFTSAIHQQNLQSCGSPQAQKKHVVGLLNFAVSSPHRGCHVSQPPCLPLAEGLQFHLGKMTNCWRVVTTAKRSEPFLRHLYSISVDSRSSPWIKTPLTD